jgi:disulfide bond formation protein DsbB
MRAHASPILRHWPALAFLTAAAMLAIAHGFETFGHLAPCTLCYWQRDVYWTALPIAAAAWILGRTSLRPLTPIAGALLTLTFLAGLGLALWHAGAEWKFWPGPSVCSGAPGAVSAAGLQALMHGAKVHAPRCDEAAWRLLGISMAGWNALISLKLAVWSGVWVVRSGRRG